MSEDMGMPAAPAATRETIRSVATDLVPDLDVIAEDMAVAIARGNGALGGALAEDTILSCRANIALVCRMMGDDEDPATAHAPADALEYARELARQGVPIEELMRAYRRGHQVFWRAFLDHLQARIADRDELASATAWCSDWTFAYVDAVSASISEVYAAERELWVRSAAAMRADEVRAILGGGDVDEADASRRLRYELGRCHVAVLLWAEHTDEVEQTAMALERLAAEAGRALGGTDVLTVRLGSLLVAAWVGLREAPKLDGALAVRSATAADIRARVAVGEPGEGLEGFRRSHHEAQQARRMATLTRRAPGSIVRYGDVALAALLSHDLDEARRFVARELGSLGAETDASRRQAATLKVFLEEGASFVRAARRLGLHENTIAYRVKRACELLGHPLEERQLELRVALLLADVLRRTGADDALPE